VGAVPGGTTEGEIRCSVPQAARLLGISERAVRKRIEAGTLAAERHPRGWEVILPPGVSGGTVGGTSPEPSEPLEAEYRVTGAAIEQAITRTAAQYAGDMRTIFERVEALYRGQLEAKDETIAELRRRAEEAERERVELRRWAEILQAERDQLRSAQDAPQASPAGTSGADDADDAWDDSQPLWRRLWQALTPRGAR
jgi:hypothetical protein